jgi:hypothetical protein
MIFVCAVITVVLHALSTVILCVEGALADETKGRVLLAEKDAALAQIRNELLRSWEPIGPAWMTIDGSSMGESVEVGATAEPDDGAWIMRATARHRSDVSRWRVHVAAERGRDGVDLPLAALAAGGVSATPERQALWVDLDPSLELDGVSTVLCYVHDPPEEPLVGSRCVVLPLASPWRLDPGWVLAAAVNDECATEVGTEQTIDASTVSCGVAPGTGTYLLTGDRGSTVRVPAEAAHGTPDAPLLVVLTGGADLDATHLDEFYGVLVVDGGSVDLEGTTVHGAVFATGAAALGESGCILYSPRILRWATDRSLQRVRLMPGTRWEAIE